MHYMYVARGFDVFLSLILYIYYTHVYTLYTYTIQCYRYRPCLHNTYVCVCVDSHKVTNAIVVDGAPKVLHENNIILQFSITVVSNITNGLRPQT